MAAMLPDAALPPENPFRMAMSSHERTGSPHRREKSIRENELLQIAWDKSMKGVGGVGLPHRRTAVPMISWDDELDDLHTGQEVEALADVFTNLFRYTVVQKRIRAGKLPQVQLAMHLAAFVFEYDSEDTLLIVYYAGHGIPVVPGQLFLAGKRKPMEIATKRNSAVWHEAEVIIKSAQADVLVIFDCCYAGNLARIGNRAWSERKFEFLAACGSASVTPIPGDDSFTSALIWALKELVNTSTRFTTMELLNKINNSAPNFPETQQAELLERDEPCLHKLVLAPLPKPGEVNDINYGPENEKKTNNQIKQFLDLRFYYDKTPDVAEILRLSGALRGLMAEKSISAQYVSWAGLKTADLTRYAVRKWRSLTASKKLWPGSPTLEIHSSRQDVSGTVPFPLFTSPPNETGTVVKVADGTREEEKTRISVVENVNIEIDNVKIISIEDQSAQSFDNLDYKMRIFIVGLVCLVLELFRLLRPVEAPAMVLLFFCVYAWYMTAQYAENASRKGSRISKYFTLIVGGISLFIFLRIVPAGIRI